MNGNSANKSDMNLTFVYKFNKLRLFALQMNSLLCFFFVFFLHFVVREFSRLGLEAC